MSNHPIQLRNGVNRLEFTHVRLLVNHYKECFLFYRDVLGFEVGWGDETSMYADFKTTAGTKIALFDRTFMAQAVGKDHLPVDANSMDKHCLIFHVDSVDETYRGLIEKGAEFINEPHDRNDWGIRVAHFRDPDGNLIEINEQIEFEP
jgi:lactoylglutathione lyase